MMIIVFNPAKLEPLKAEWARNNRGPKHPHPILSMSEKDREKYLKGIWNTEAN